MVPDTLRILNLSPGPNIPLEYLGLLGVLLGASITFFGNWILAKRQVRIEIQRAFFLRRLEVYVRLAEIIWEVHSVRVKDASAEPIDAYPQAYESFERLKDWLGDTVAHVDKNRLLLDQKTYDAFIALDKKIVEHLKQLKASSSSEIIDSATRNLGRKEVENLQQLATKIMESISRYIRGEYQVSV